MNSVGGGMCVGDKGCPYCAHEEENTEGGMVKLPTRLEAQRGDSRILKLRHS